MPRPLIVLAGVGALCTTAAFAQAPAARPDVLTQLLSEVHELRLTLQHQGADTARIQLLISRLTIQESRVSRLARDLDGVRDQLARTTTEQRQFAERIKEMEGSVSQVTDPPERVSMEQQLKMMNQQLGEMRRLELRLRAQESELESSLGAEQARWIEVSNRLDELERSLARP